MLLHDKQAYVVACKRGLVGDLGLIKARKPANRPEGYWTIERCIDAAKQCSTKEEFKERFAYAIVVLQKHGLLWDKEIFSHFKRKTGSNIYEPFRSKDECARIAKLYKTKADFMDKAARVYKYALKYKWLDEIGSHFGSIRGGFDKTKVGYLYVVSFGEYIGFGIANRLAKRLGSHKSTTQKVNLELKILKLIEFDVGVDAENVERKLKSLPIIVDTGLTGFRTEAVLRKDLEILTEILEKELTSCTGSYKILTTESVDYRRGEFVSPVGSLEFD